MSDALENLIPYNFICRSEPILQRLMFSDTMFISVCVYMLKVKRAGKGKDKPSDKVLKNAIVEILKRVDFSTVRNFSTFYIRYT